MASERRTLVAVALIAALAACASGPSHAPNAKPAGDEAVLEDLERRTFDFFWATTNPSNGLVPDRYPTPAFSSIAAVGFGLTSYLVGVERGWITREQARERVLTTLRFFWTAPQGAEATNVTGHRGFFYHFLDMERGLRFEKVELSTIDTGLLLMGVLSARQYFDRPDAGDSTVRALAD